MMHRLLEIGYLRLSQIIGKPATATERAIPALIPVSRSTWWAGVKTGRYPQPIRSLGARITAWRVEDIRALIGRAAANG
jgi:predicted DNA-binding transcriptional regulator AlpA